MAYFHLQTLKTSFEISVFQNQKFENTWQKIELGNKNRGAGGKTLLTVKARWSNTNRVIQFVRTSRPWSRLGPCLFLIFHDTHSKLEARKSSAHTSTQRLSLTGWVGGDREPCAWNFCTFEHISMKSKQLLPKICLNLSLHKDRY